MVRVPLAGNPSRVFRFFYSQGVTQGKGTPAAFFCFYCFSFSRSHSGESCFFFLLLLLFSFQGVTQGSRVYCFFFFSRSHSGEWYQATRERGKLPASSSVHFYMAGIRSGQDSFGLFDLAQGDRFAHDLRKQPSGFCPCPKKQQKEPLADFPGCLGSPWVYVYLPILFRDPSLPKTGQTTGK